MAINRRQFIKALSLAAVSLGCVGAEELINSRDGKSKPNILIILADDMGYSD